MTEHSADRAFPLIFAGRVADTASFYSKLGFVEAKRNPPVGEPTYVALRRGPYELAVVDASWPWQRYGGTVGDLPRFEMFVLVDDLDGTLDRLADDGVAKLCEPVVMPWGERIAYVADPDGNPVALACQEA